MKRGCDSDLKHFYWSEMPENINDVFFWVGICSSTHQCYNWMLTWKCVVVIHYLSSCPWKTEFPFWHQNGNLLRSYFPPMEYGGLWREAVTVTDERSLSSFSSLFSLVLSEMTMLPCYRNASCIPRWKEQDVADAHRFFQPAGPALRPSQ